MMEINQQHSDHQKAFFNRRTKWLTYLLLSILIGVVLTIEDFLHDEDLSMVGLEFLAFVPIMTLLFIGIGQLARWSIDRWRLSTIWRDKRWREVLFIIFWWLGVSFILAFMLLEINNLLPDLDDDEVSFFDFTWLVWVATMLAIAISLVVETFWEVFIKRQALELLNERLMRSHDLAKYQALMNQINPHFLFNSLNVLSYLVYQNPRDAERFIEELSKIYRYILQLNEAYLVPLKEELEFIDSYIYLQKIRYQGNLQFEAKVEADALNQLIPPLTLEVLVENAIKHNTIAAELPLWIELQTQNGHLEIRNPLQPRQDPPQSSTKVGLQNLKEKFAILESPSPRFYTQNGTFIAQIPLLNPET